MKDRGRMIFDLPPEVQMAIKLRAVKGSMTTGEVVSIAIRQIFPDDIASAEKAIKEARQP